MSTPVWALPSRVAVASAKVMLGVVPWMSARTPETCGHAIEVPDMVSVAVSEANPALVMSEPGA